MEITNEAVQTVSAGSNVLFNETPVAGNCCIMHRDGSGIVTLRGLTKQCNAKFKVSFGGNAAIPTDEDVVPISIAIAIAGEPVAGTTMTVTPTETDSAFNIFSSVIVSVPRDCCVTISVNNRSPIPVNITNANLIVTRIA